MKYQYLNADEMIRRTIILNESRANPSKSPLHIAYGIDRNFLLGCGVSITSILLHNRDINFVFHVFIDEIYEDDEKRFSELATSYNTSIQVHIVNCDRLRSFPTTKNWSIAMYFRFVIGDYFIGLEEKILYLDADIVCQNKIDELTTIDLGSYVAGVVPERDEKWWALRAKSLDCDDIVSGYFNSGVLLLNIPAWSTEFVSKKAISMLADRKLTAKLTYMDQDILNLILLRKVKFIDGKYNTQFSLNYELKEKYISPISERTALIHYVGPTKPWHSWASYPSSEPFLNAKQLSPWKNTSLMRPNTSNYARYCAKHNFKQNKIMHGIINYIYYYYLKVVK
ncbi:UDP-glucose:(glucosyl)LPS alpha-1,3-glucosyltransferase [Buttiauxella sp. BIGb0471]|uniref:lipopolysaccharide 3-alpha-galactosyltransferase n=1 Tax=Buttiauxella sp. BIGb0471 TaxID=2940597 RepID=UPI00216857D2|nr:lipopolysaccharide 3-alpha-galactosyltransferase [Buttiauxella sp. BIGb0471]MCS3604770.1 UDP-glucose:(glucosyl)LPS alpha-1,3-glucosyltransferase [Buttiauxella sp. BIGb0471]